MLPAEHVWYVEPRRPGEIAARLAELSRAGPPDGALRQHFLAHFTIERHVSALIAAVRTIA